MRGQSSEVRCQNAERPDGVNHCTRGFACVPPDLLERVVPGMAARRRLSSLDMTGAGVHHSGQLGHSPIVQTGNPV